MPIYAYKAITPSGTLKQNEIEAISESQARSQLQIRGERVLQLNEISISQKAASVSRGGKRPTADEVASTIRQLSILIRAGVPLVEALDGLAEQANSGTLSRCIAEVAVNVSQGASLSDCFAMHPSVFPSLAVEMARIAEAGGDLAESMERLAEHMENSAEIARKVKSALSYPIVIVFLSIATVIVMVTFILPRFMKLFDRMGAELPWTTKTLMSISHAMTHQWYIFIAGTAITVYLAKKFARSQSGKRKLDTIAMKLPLVGDIVTKVVLSRVIASMATLLSSGVPMVQTLKTSAAAANNELVKEALLKASEDVAQGSATSQSLKASGIFPPLVLQMVTSGEKTGELPVMLDYICSMYSRETDAKVKSLTSVIEPIMIVVLGIIVGFIAMSVIVPIYSLVGGVK